MTPEQIAKLTKLQENIASMEKTKAKLVRDRLNVSLRFPSSNGYSEKVPLDMIPGLLQEIVDMTIDQFEDQIYQLKETRDALILCKADKAEPNYKPTDID